MCVRVCVRVCSVDVYEREDTSRFNDRLILMGELDRDDGGAFPRFGRTHHKTLPVV